jgi:hypothetical protein
MGLGNYPFAALTTIRGIAFRLLEKFTPEKIAHTGIEVICLLETIRSQHPEKVPTKPSGGLLEMGPIPFNDFELAQHLTVTNDPEMAKVIKDARDVPVLLAYLAIITNSSELPDEYLLESALPFVVETLVMEGEDAKRWRVELKIKSDSAAKNLRERNAINAALPRPNARAIDHEDVLNEYRHLLREGHTEREARGILVQRGNMGSQTTIYRITKRSSH